MKINPLNIFCLSRKQLKHGSEGVEVGSDVEIKWAAHLLQLNVNGIIRHQIYHVKILYLKRGPKLS